MIERFGRAWRECPLRPKPSRNVVDHWSRLVTDWIRSDDMPLFIRKTSNNRGAIVVHESGRSLVPCDNSPAHWAYVMALRGDCPSLNDVRTLLAGDAIPVAMIQKSVEKPIARFHCTRPKKFNLNEFGWKLAHMERVGLKDRVALTSVSIERLTTHFRLLMSPANMFVVPLAWAGIAEIEAVVQAVGSAS